MTLQPRPCAADGFKPVRAAARPLHHAAAPAGQRCAGSPGKVGLSVRQAGAHAKRLPSEAVGARMHRPRPRRPALQHRKTHHGWHADSRHPFQAHTKAHLAWKQAQARWFQLCGTARRSFPLPDPRDGRRVSRGKVGLIVRRRQAARPGEPHRSVPADAGCTTPAALQHRNTHLACARQPGPTLPAQLSPPCRAIAQARGAAGSRLACHDGAAGGLDGLPRGCSVLASGASGAAGTAGRRGFGFSPGRQIKPQASIFRKPASISEGRKSF
jgi:hypothetical protein